MRRPRAREMSCFQTTNMGTAAPGRMCTSKSFLPQASGSVFNRNKYNIPFESILQQTFTSLENVCPNVDALERHLFTPQSMRQYSDQFPPHDAKKNHFITLVGSRGFDKPSLSLQNRLYYFPRKPFPIFGVCPSPHWCSM